MKTKLIILSIAALCLSTAPVLGNIVNPNRPWGSAGSLTELQNLFNSIGATSIDALNDQTGFGYFEAGGAGNATAAYIATISYAGDLEFGIYELGDTTNTLKVFDQSAVSGQSVAIVFDDDTTDSTPIPEVRVVDLGGGGVLATAPYFNTFGFYSIGDPNPLGDPHTYYSEDTLNAAGEARFLTYAGEGDDVEIPIGTTARDDSAHWYVASESGDYTPNNDTTGADFTDFVVQMESILPVPVPGAVLLGILGLSAAGIKLRKFA
jgi:hypothetical protein